MAELQDHLRTVTRHLKAGNTDYAIQCATEERPGLLFRLLLAHGHRFTNIASLLREAAQRGFPGHVRIVLDHYRGSPEELKKAATAALPHIDDVGHPQAITDLLDVGADPSECLGWILRTISAQRREKLWAELLPRARADYDLQLELLTSLMESSSSTDYYRLHEPSMEIPDVVRPPVTESWYLDYVGQLAPGLKEDDVGSLLRSLYDSQHCLAFKLAIMDKLCDACGELQHQTVVWVLRDLLLNHRPELLERFLPRARAVLEPDHDPSARAVLAAFLKPAEISGHAAQSPWPSMIHYLRRHGVPFPYINVYNLLRKLEEYQDACRKLSERERKVHYSLNYGGTLVALMKHGLVKSIDHKRADVIFPKGLTEEARGYFRALSDQKAITGLSLLALMERYSTLRTFVPLPFPPAVRDALVRCLGKDLAKYIWDAVDPY